MLHWLADSNCCFVSVFARLCVLLLVSCLISPISVVISLRLNMTHDLAAFVGKLDDSCFTGVLSLFARGDLVRVENYRLIALQDNSVLT